MACNCSKKRQGQGTAYAGRASQTVPYSKAETQSGPTRVEFPDGEIREYATRLEAHAAKMIAGGGKILG